MYQMPAVLAEIVDRDDVRMVEPPGRLRFAAEARDHGLGVLAGELIGADRLQRDDALDHRIVAFVDDAHRAAPDLAPDLVFAECCSMSAMRHAPRASKTATPAASRRRGRSASAGVTCTCCRFPRRDFCTSRCTIVSSDTPPCCDCETPSTDVDVAPTSIFSSV